MNHKKSKQIVISILFSIIIFILISSSNFSATQTDNPTLILEKEIYSLGEEINIQIDSKNVLLKELNVVVYNNDNVFKYYGLSSNKIKLNSKFNGTYLISLESKSGISYDKKEISVIDEPKNIISQISNLNLLSTSKDVYELNEEVFIYSNVTGEKFNLEIISNDAKIKYIGIDKNNISFFPKFPGVYELRLLSSNDIISRIEFLVINQNGEQKAIINSNFIPLHNAFDKSSNDSFNSFDSNSSFEMFKTHNSRGEIKFVKQRKIKDLFTNESIDEIEINDHVKKIRFKNLSSNSTRLGIENVPSKNIKFDDKKIVASFAIDPQSMNFTEAEVTVTASGKELYKCVDWSFATSTCLGVWIKIKDLTPGTDYTFNITPTDPGFAETGVATINSKKPIYLPGENAEILIAVLDNQGYLVSNAMLDVSIVSPENTTYTFSNNLFSSDINEISNGIYKLDFTNTFVLGNYSIFVNASAPGVDYAMFSNFLVQDTIDFDIVRDTPMSIDPWAGPFNSTINIVSYINTNDLTLIEKIPLDYNVSDSGGAVVVDTNETRNLMWTSTVPNFSVVYSLQTPLITPDLRKFEAEIVYVDPLTLNFVSFKEARPWYLAVDPVMKLNGTVCAELENDAAYNPANYGATCGAGFDTNLATNDTNIITQAAATTGNYAGIRVGYNLNIPQCTNITNVTYCHRWFYSGSGTCMNISFSTVGTGVPGTWTPFGSCTATTTTPVVCVDLTNRRNWTCSNFNNGNLYVRTLMVKAAGGALGITEDVMFFNVTYDVDSYPPNFSNEWRNVTQPHFNDSIIFNITASDNQTNISFAIFSWNDTGSWTNTSYACSQGLSCNASIVKNLTAAVGSYVCYKWYANDSVNPYNLNESNISCFNVNMVPIINLTSNSPFNELVTLSSLNTFYFIVNATNVDSCSLIVNGSSVNSSILITPNVEQNFSYNFTSQGKYLWNINCSDGIIVSSEKRNITIKLTDDPPNITLLSPQNGIIINTTTSFLCNVTDDIDLTVVNLYTNITGTWDVIQNYPLGGINDKSIVVNFTLYNLTPDLNFIWNCEAKDKPTVSVFAPLNYSVTVGSPIVVLNSPFNYGYDIDGTVTFNCTASDMVDIENVTLFTDATGVWQSISSLSFPGINNKSVNAIFQGIGLPNGTEIHWNCLATNNQSGFTNYKFAPNNYTLTVLPIGVPYYASINSFNSTFTANTGGTGGGWFNPNFSTLSPDGAYSTIYLQNSNNLDTYNYTSLPTKGTLLGVYAAFTWQISSTTGNDLLAVCYSNNSRTTWYDLDGTACTNTFGPARPSAAKVWTNYSGLITAPISLSQLPNLSIRVKGNVSGGADNYLGYIDSLYIRLQVSPPPWYTNLSKSKDLIYQNDDVTFNITWNHDIKLGCYIFSFNNGSVWTNSSCISMSGKSYNANYTIHIDSQPGQLIEWKFYANNTFNVWNETPSKYFYVLDILDLSTPFINSVIVNPTINSSGVLFNITANVTDAGKGTGAVDAEIIFSDMSTQIFPMTQVSADLWNYLFLSLMGGNHNVVIHANDGTNIATPYSPTYFNVTPYILPFNNFYGREESVYIEGRGFSANSNVNMKIFDPNGELIDESTVVSQSNGSISTSWYIPPAVSGGVDKSTLLGNYTIILNDSLVYPYLVVQSNFFVIKRIDYALMYDQDNTGGSFVENYLLKDNDGLVMEARGRNGAQTDFNLSFLNTIPSGYNMTRLVLYFRHIDGFRIVNYPQVYLRTATAWVLANCTPINFRGVWTIDTCDFTTNLSRIPDKNNIMIRLNYDDTNDHRGYIMTVADFAGIYANWTQGQNLSITITSPILDISKVNFTSVNSLAYNGTLTGGAPPNPPPGNPPLTGSSFSNISNITSIDTKTYITTVNAANTYTYQSFYFTITQQITDVQKVTFDYVGKASQTAGDSGTGFRVFVYNYNTQTYVLLRQVPSTDTDLKDLELLIPSPITNYINSTSNQMNFVVHNYQDPVNLKKLHTDYAGISVYTSPTLSGIVDINATATDSDGVLGCDYHFTNSSGYNFNYYNMNNTEGATYSNFSDTSIYRDGIYNLSVNCSANYGEKNTSIMRVKLLNSAPFVILKSPLNGSNFTNTTVTLKWLSNSTSGGNPLCDLYVDSSLVFTDIVSYINQNISKNITNLLDGEHNWYVSCHMEGVSAYNTTEPWYFYVDARPPNITLDYPLNNTYLSNLNLTFYYTPLDVFNISFCNLTVDNLYVNSSRSILNGIQNNISYTLASGGKHNWSINCTDVHNNTNYSKKYTFYIDLINPFNITLNGPAPGALVDEYVTFNFTAYDNMDTLLNCTINLSDGSSYSVTANNGTPKTHTPITALGDGLKFWNVTCFDDAGRSNISLTRNFTVFGLPTVNLISPLGTSSNNQLFTLTYYPSATLGIKNCSLYIDNTYNQTNFTIDNGINNYFTIFVSQERRYNWSVECYSNNSNKYKPPNSNFTYDNTTPSIVLNKLDNNSIVTGTNINFNFTVIDNLDKNLTCNLTIDGTTKNSNINANNGSLTNTLATSLPAGQRNWSVTCWDDALNTITSEIRYFYLGSKPIIILQNPANNAYRKENITFMYNVSDQASKSILNCSLYINNVWNQSNSSINKNQNNYFYLYNLFDQTLNWSIECYNNDPISDISSIRNVTIDNTPPNITLKYPKFPNYAQQNTTMKFNFTVNDSYPTLNCSLYIDDLLNKSQVVSVGTTIITVNNISTGTHNWSVTCRDNTSNIGYSEVTDFIIASGPDVILVTPIDKDLISNDTIDFNYTVNPLSGAINNCSLLFNNTIITTVDGADIVQDGSTVNNFTISGLTQRILNWTVRCYDILDISTTATPQRNLHIDWTTLTNVTLNSPTQGQPVGQVNITFRFTPYDNVDDILSCNLSVYNETDLVANVTNINATNKVQNATTVYNFSNPGLYFWNVTCTDGYQGVSSNTSNFTLSGKPAITLYSPLNNFVSSNNNLLFNYSVSTIYPPLTYCGLFLDGIEIDSNTTPNNGLNYFNITIPEGKHNWTVLCNNSKGEWDNGTLVYNLTVDLHNPTVFAISPNGSTLFNSTVIFNISVIDNLDNQLSCNITINGTVRAQNILVNNDTSVLSPPIAGFNDSFYVWNATCIDDSGRTNTSETYNFTIAEPPRIILNTPQINLRTKIQTQTFNFTPTDNSGNIASCKLILNGVANETNTTVTNGTYTFITSTLDNGFYNWTINCTDYAGNEGQATTSRNITIDIYGPNITIHEPLNSSIHNQNFVLFNFTPIDEFGGAITCNLTIDDFVNITLINTTSGINTNRTVYNFTKGWHNYSITCWDILNNTNTTNLTWFFINSADVYIDNSRVRFNSTNPNIGDNITIFANVTNIGGVIATNLLVEFWDGTPGVGVYIGNTTIDVPRLQNITTNISWIITPGYHNIWVNLINGTDDKNLSNHNATISISVLISNITYPLNNSWSYYGNPEINFTLQDFTNGEINYTIFMDGSANTQIGNTTDNITTNLTINPALSQGLHYIIVQAKDALSRFKNSSRLYINIDYNAPIANFITKNNTWFNITTFDVRFNLTDAYSPNITFAVYFDDVFVNNSNVLVNSSVNQTLGPYAQGQHNITVEAMDVAFNKKNYTISIYIDTAAPTITQITPVNNSNFTVRIVTLNITGNDNLAPSLNCSITLDNLVVKNNIITNGANLTYTNTTLIEGTHFWNATCIDNATNIFNTETFSFNVYIPPLLTLVHPSNNNWSNTSSNTFYFNTTDETGFSNCSVLINGVINATIDNSQIINGATNNITTTLYDGIYNWSIMCVDNTTWHSFNLSLNRTLTVDLTAPQIIINSPVNNSNFTNRSVTINISTTDNLAQTINCSITLDGLIVKNASLSNGSSMSYTNNSLIEGTHIWNATCYDTLYNTYTTPIQTFNVYIPPLLTLVDPQNNFLSNTSLNYFFFNSSDETGFSNCSVLINGIVNATIDNSQIINGATNNITTTLYDGIYNWSIMCVDNTTWHSFNLSLNRTLTVDLTAPQIIINSPVNNSNFTNRSVTINISTTDNLAQTINCSITLDGLIVKNVSLSNGSSMSYTNNSLIEGTHIWNATCYDTAYNTYTTPIQTFNVYIPPLIVLVSPANNNWTKTGLNSFDFNISDETGFTNCSIIANNVIYNTLNSASLTNYVTNTITATFTEGIYNWSIACFDNTTWHSYNISNNRTIYVDLTPPTPKILNLTGFWTNSRNITLGLNLSDNMALNLNYFLSDNGVPNITKTVSNPTNNLNDWIWISTGLTHILNVTLIDTAGNINTTNITIYYDAVPPVITLISPLNGNITNDINVTLNFSVSDADSPTLNCNLTLDGVVVKNYSSLSNPTTINETFNGMQFGIHYWNVTCIDLARNINTSVTWNFSVPKPDLVINTNNITFDIYNATENQTVNIFANVYNLGNKDAFNILVRFYEGDPDAGGTQLGTDQIITSLLQGQNYTLNTTWTTALGTNVIYVVVDPPTSSGGVINESNEGNNKALRAYAIGSYNIVSGNLSGNLEITNAAYTTLYQWGEKNISGNNIMVADFDSTPDFFNLQAIGKTVTNVTEFNDFSDIDNALGSQNFVDSINLTYTQNGAPIQLKNFTVFRKLIANVPVVNSTNASSFVTGILWDKTDGNTHYNGSQDLVFITEVNESNTGYLGVVDFEIKIPALLRGYKNPDTRRVTFYTELK